MRLQGFLTRRAKSVWTIPFVGLVLGAIVLTAHFDIAWDVRALAKEAVHDPLILGTVLIVYIALIATPFVPGAEIGLFLLALFGAPMAGPVYMATVVALTLSFLVGQSLPRVSLLGLQRPTEYWSAASQHLLGSELTASTPSNWLRHLVRFRWLALILLINMPGNTLLGGGGGIAMAVGNSRVFTIWTFLFSAAVAVAPVPFVVVLADHFDAGATLGRWLQSVVGAIDPRALDH